MKQIEPQRSVGQKYTNIHVIRASEGMGESEKIFEEITGEIFPNLTENIYLYIQKSQLSPSKINTKRSTPGHIFVELFKSSTKKKIWKARQKIMICKGTTM